jgi:AAA15 family ATPase/GTPase
MLPSKRRLKAHHKNSKIKGVSTLKTALIYGANASGKSNMVKALKFGRDLMLKPNGAKSISYQKFRLSEKSGSENSRIEYELQHKDKNYAYGFIFNNNEIVEEWLYEISKKAEKEIFSRKNTTEFNLEPLFSVNKVDEEKSFLDFTAKGTPHHRLFLSEISTRNVKENVSSVDDLLAVIDWFKNALKVISPDDKYNEGLKFEISNNQKLEKLYGSLLSYFDTGITKVALKDIKPELVSIPEGLRKKIHEDLLDDSSEAVRTMISTPNESYMIFENDGDARYQKFVTMHRHSEGQSDVPFDSRDESDGTNRMMDFVPVILDLLKGGNVFIIDEMERSLHPNIIYDIIDLYLEKCQSVHSQLIVASHEASLLNKNLLRQDEIWFTHKGEKTGATEISSLEEYSVRFDKEIRKDYLLGRYKAIPRIGNRSSLEL